MALQWEVQHFQPQQEFICRLINILQYPWHYTLPKFENDLLVTFILFLNECTWKTFSITSMQEESNGELAFLDILLKRNNGKNSVLVYRNTINTDQYIYHSSHHQTSCKESVVSSLFNRAYSIIPNKDDFYKEKKNVKEEWISGKHYY